MQVDIYSNIQIIEEFATLILVPGRISGKIQKRIQDLNNIINEICLIYLSKSSP